MDNKILTTNERFLHIFIYVIKQKEDHFLGIKNTLANRQNQLICDVRLSDDEYQVIEKVEYNRHKILSRIFNYHKIFRILEQKLKWVLCSVDKYAQIYVYLADEGIWGEFLRTVLSRYRQSVVTVNIQHGVFLIQRVRFLLLRKLVNSIFVSFTKYPLIGLGVGGSRFNKYYVYGDKEKEYIRRRSPESQVVIEPLICKYHLFSNYLVVRQKMRVDEIEKKNNILFAMQLPEIMKGFIPDERETYKLLLPLFQFLSTLGYSILLRFHPHTPDTRASRVLLHEVGLDRYISDATDENYFVLMNKVGIVMSFVSTALIDGYYLGKLPIMLRGFMRNEKGFPIPHESVNIKNDWRAEIVRSLHAKSKYANTSLLSSDSLDIILN